MQNQVYSYVSGEKSTEKMPTDGIRPPAGNSIPLAFHKKSGKVVALVDTADYAQTWLYDYATDKWQHIKGGDFPYSIGTNYSMEYDEVHNSGGQSTLYDNSELSKITSARTDVTVRILTGTHITFKHYLLDTIASLDELAFEIGVTIEVHR